MKTIRLFLSKRRKGKKRMSDRVFNIVSTIVIIIGIVVGIGVSAIIGCPAIIFIICLVTEDAGKLDSVGKIAEVVTENQESLQDIVAQVLTPEQDLDITIDVGEKEFQDLSSSEDADEEAFHLEDIYPLAEELEIRKIKGYKNADVDMVIFETYSSGIVGSSDAKGFLYLEQDMTEDIFEYGYFCWRRSYDYSEITDNWYYYNISY